MTEFGLDIPGYADSDEEWDRWREAQNRPAPTPGLVPAPSATLPEYMESDETPRGVQIDPYLKSIIDTGWYANKQIPGYSQGYSGNPQTVQERDWITNYINQFGTRPSTEAFGRSGIKGNTFLPGSTSYEMGFRTEAERLASNPAGLDVFGPHGGSMIDPGGLILTDETGKPYKRIWGGTSPGSQETINTALKGGYFIKPPGQAGKGLPADYMERYAPEMVGVKTKTGGTYEDFIKSIYPEAAKAPTPWQKPSKDELMKGINPQDLGFAKLQDYFDQVKARVGTVNPKELQNIDISFATTVNNLATLATQVSSIFSGLGAGGTSETYSALAKILTDYAGSTDAEGNPIDQRTIDYINGIVGQLQNIHQEGAGRIGEKWAVTSPEELAKLKATGVQPQMSVEVLKTLMASAFDKARQDLASKYDALKTVRDESKIIQEVANIFGKGGSPESLALWSQIQNIEGRHVGTLLAQRLTGMQTQTNQELAAYEAANSNRTMPGQGWQPGQPVSQEPSQQQRYTQGVTGYERAQFGQWASNFAEPVTKWLQDNYNQLFDMWQASGMNEGFLAFAENYLGGGV